MPGHARVHFWGKIAWKTCGLFETFRRLSRARDAQALVMESLAMRACLGIAASVILASSATALADGMPSRNAPCCAPYSWAGFYLGANVGAAWGDLTTRDRDEFGGTFKNRSTDVFGGGQIGFNLQRGNWVFGPEVDLGGMGLSHTASEPGTGGIILSKIDSGFYGDVTGRLGYSFGPALLYGKGGFAFYDGSVTNTDLGDPSSVKDSTHTGWTVGGGLEYKLNPTWSVKAEYLHFDFGSDRLHLPSDGDRYDNKLSTDTVKVGINFHFGEGVTRYAPLK
jgi:outer membrane immunogenic protein